MESFTEFGKIAEFLKHPLVLMGFVLMMAFSIHKQILKAGLLPKLNQKQGSSIVTLLLRYGFWLGVLIVLLGFSLQFYQAYVETSKRAIAEKTTATQIEKKDDKNSNNSNVTSGDNSPIINADGNVTINDNNK